MKRKETIIELEEMRCPINLNEIWPPQNAWHIASNHLFHDLRRQLSDKYPGVMHPRDFVLTYTRNPVCLREDIDIIWCGELIGCFEYYDSEEVIVFKPRYAKIHYLLNMPPV